MEFLAKVREAYPNGSLEITIDSKIVEALGINKGQIITVEIKEK